MSFFAKVDRKTRRFKRRLAELIHTAPDKLGYPSYSWRIQDRQRRWAEADRPHFAHELRGKREGAAYVSALGYAVPQVYGRYASLHDLPPLDQLPRNFALKPESDHSTHNVFLMRDGVNQFDGRRMTREDIIAAVGPRCDQAFTAEELLENFDGRPGAPLDYKFFCFGPKVVSIFVIERNSDKKYWLNRYWFRNPDWSRQWTRMRWDLYPELSAPPKPPCLDEMLRMASDLGGRLNIFVRVDLYATTRGPVFGEFTPTPGMGYHTTPAADAWLGRLWQGEEGCDGATAAIPTPEYDPAKDDGLLSA